MAEKIKKEDQERFQGLMYRVQMLQKELQELNKQLGLVEYKRGEISETIKAVKDLPEAKESECMVPIGSGVFLKARLLDKTRSVIATGAGIFSEKSNKDTIVFLEGQIAKMDEDEQVLKNQAMQVQQELESYSAEANQMMAKTKAGR